MPDYSKTVIYKLCCNDTTIEDIYVGSTCNFTHRKYQHKSNCNNPNNKDYNYKVYQFIRDHGGFSNWDMVMVHQEAVENKLQKERLERQYIDELKPSLNIQLPTRTKDEWTSDNKEYMQQYQTQYKIENKERIKAIKNQKYDCECGGKFTHTNKTQHLSSKKHIKYMEENYA